MEINPSTSSLTKTYIYANSQPIAHHDGPPAASLYFYLHDRLGSVRQIVDPASIQRVQADGRVVRESLLAGPNGLVKLKTVWEGTKLITMKVFGG